MVSVTAGRLSQWLRQLNIGLQCATAALSNMLSCAIHRSRFYTGMADPIPGNSGMAKRPGFPGIGKMGALEGIP